MLRFLEKAALNSDDRDAPFRETRAKTRTPPFPRPQSWHAPPAPPLVPAARPARGAAAAAAAPAAPDSARITLEHFGIDMRVDEVLPLHEQALYPGSGGVPSLPGVEEVVCAMNKAGELVTTARRRRRFSLCLRALCAGMMSSVASRTREYF
jgi:hypothetical protein